MALILLADDVALTRETLARSLREKSHRVLVVADGQEAIDRCQRERPDLMILDVVMPRVTGLEACARIKATPGTFLPVIFVSARLDMETRLACLAAGEDFVAKPYDTQELCARVDTHLRTRRLVEELRQRAEASPTGESPTDSVTGLPSGIVDRVAFLVRLEDEWKRSARSTDPLAVVVASVDNPGSAPATGTQSAIAVLGASMQRCLRSIDVIGRADETHLCALLLNTHVTGTMAAIERLKRELRKQLVDGRQPVVSMGVSFHPGREVSDPPDLLRVAEYAIARAREHGPGAVCLYQNQGYIYTLD